MRGLNGYYPTDSTFRHKEIGELGRLRLKEVNGRTWINCEAVGDQDDPMTVKRQAIFEQPVGKGIAVHKERILGKSAADGPPSATSASATGGKSPCRKQNDAVCSMSTGAFVAMLIFADDAKTPDRLEDLEDYARLMYPNLFKREPAN